MMHPIATRIVTVLVALSSLVWLPCVAQSTGLEDVRTLMMDSATIGEARTRLEAALKSDPNDVEALMLMGNVIYKEYHFSKGPLASTAVELRAADDESVYDQSMGFLMDPIDVVPADVADRITAHWLKAVDVDPSRTDIHMGICHIYSISMQAEKLLDHLPVLKAHMAVDPETPYSLADYARNLIERDHFTDGMRVYERISELFPECGGILSDIGGEYFQAGDPVKAKQWVDKAMARSDKDDMTFGNAFFIYAVLEENDKALAAVHEQCRLNHTAEDLLYQAILELVAKKDPAATLKEYVARPEATEAGIAVANTLLRGSPDSLRTYEAVADADLNDGFMVPLHHLFRDRIGGFLPGFNYAEALGYNHRHADAVKAFDAIALNGASPGDVERMRFYKAWSVQQSKGIEAAVDVWQPLLGSSNSVYKDAATYFIGKYHLGKGEQKEADELFRSVTSDASDNKYAMMCAQLLGDR